MTNAIRLLADFIFILSSRIIIAKRPADMQKCGKFEWLSKNSTVSRATWHGKNRPLSVQSPGVTSGERGGRRSREKTYRKRYVNLIRQEASERKWTKIKMNELDRSIRTIIMYRCSI